VGVDAVACGLCEETCAVSGAFFCEAEVPHGEMKDGEEFVVRDSEHASV